MSQRAVARSLGLGLGTVSKYVNRARRAGLTWPLPRSWMTTSSSSAACIRRPPIAPARSVRSRIGRSCIASCGAGTSR
ncbi:winged helix-turn-helix domain-containing protein [Bradyrhizobium sp. CCBAU 45389]|uniref:winged helix-turn-helix domain-containing protein n=1 Tax=Bradyrhizobium sp. CCBAU 45389 TaxID=858429 RepID=UPI002FE3D16B